MICECRGDRETLLFPAPMAFVKLLLNCDRKRGDLPRIETYGNCPVFGPDFSFLGRGWHSDTGVLIHSPEVEPVLPPLVEAGSALGRLSRHLHRLLGGLCLMADADVANTIGAFL